MMTLHEYLKVINNSFFLTRALEVLLLNKNPVECKGNPIIVIPFFRSTCMKQCVAYENVILFPWIRMLYSAGCHVSNSNRGFVTWHSFLQETYKTLSAWLTDQQHFPESLHFRDMLTKLHAIMNKLLSFVIVLCFN